MVTGCKFIDLFVTLPSFPLFLCYIAITTSWRFWRKMVPRAGELSKLLAVHNLVCILLSASAFVGLLYHLMFESESIYSKSSDSKLLKKFFLLYSVSKIYELFDTVFMMARQKSRQISFLHVYHHSSMVLLADCAYRKFPWPCMAFGECLNSFIHIFVYGYYLTSNFAPVNFQWKKLITQLQLAQFFIGVVFCFCGIVRHGFCWYSLLFDLTMLYLFSRFYYRTYYCEHHSAAVSVGSEKKVE